MCAPIALTGLQLVSSFAGAAAARRDLSRQAREAEQDARAAAGAASARAEFSLDAALRRSAETRARAFASGADPRSESLVASLAAAHASNLDESRWLDHSGATALEEGRMRARNLRASRRTLEARSLLGAAQTLVGPSWWRG
jgi:hypothetical protein